MTTFMRRMLGAAKLDARTFEEVEANEGATAQALGVVLLASVAAGIGAMGFGDASVKLVVAGALAAVLGWGAWAVLIYYIGTRLLPGPQTDATVGQLLRTTGFAQAPGLLRIVAIVPGLGSLIWPVAALWMLVAMVVGVRQALDYTSSLRALGVCLTGWIVSIVLAVVVGMLFGPTLS